MRRNHSTTRPGRHRRGVTLLEMLVEVALVVLMMTILASIFQAATGTISASMKLTELDNSLRGIDTTLRHDLAGITARMTPPLDPALKLGYFEYGENAPADAQGEDTDDYLAFTTKAPEGQTFVGRYWVPNNATTVTNTSILPVTVSSQFAEVIYFLRNGNLYRRVLLIKPELREKFAINGNSGGAVSNRFFANAFGGSLATGWMSVNDISARPSGTNGATGTASFPIPNDLGDLTNRENRFARQRFGNDYYNALSNSSGSRDGIADDGNRDVLPDYYPTLTVTQVLRAASTSPSAYSGGVSGLLMNEDSGSMPGGSVAGGYARIAPSLDAYAFPFVYPAMYSKPEASTINTAYGWLHAIDTLANGGVVTSGGNGIYNHAPVEFGDSLPIPTSNSANPHQFTTWFGFPTWRETASVNWRDPIYGPMTPSSGVSGSQSPGLNAFDQTVTPNLGSTTFPPALGANGITLAPVGSDGAGSVNFTTPLAVWDDDLILSGVRSFDVKAFDPQASVYNYYNLGLAGTLPAYNAGYYDLGYAASDYTRAGNPSLLTGTPSAIMDGLNNPRGFGHEGRIPPNTTDNRVDPQRPIVKDVNGLPTPNNVGDNSPALQRLRRVFDTWSTTYTNAPDVDLNQRGSPLQPYPYDRPIYPSYPAPYPQALRGIQVQIRVVDPRNEKVKVLTIQQDFTDKL